MTRPVVFLSQPMHPAGIELLKTRAEVIEGVFHPVASAADIEAALARSDAVVIRSMPIRADRMDKAPRLKVIAKHGAGMDSIDIPAATERGIVVANSGDTNAFAVAQQAVALMMAVLRDVVNVDAIVRGGGYQQREKMTGLGDLWEATVGVVGVGNIGRHAARMVGGGFQAKVLGFDPLMSAADMEGLGVEKVDDLHALLRRADIVTLHLPLNAHTRGLIGRAELAQMKPEAVIVNTSRGEVIDEAALFEALTEGRIAGAGLDVLEQEPPTLDNPLFKLRNVVLSPHVGGGSRVALKKTALATAEVILAVLDGRTPKNLANPEAVVRAGTNLPQARASIPP